jgi:alginate O-acetyltransferase complex protein AlgI
VIFGVAFFAFAAAVAGIYWLIPRPRWRAGWLALASLLFVGHYDRGAAVVVVALTVYSYLAAGLVEQHRDRHWPHRLGVTGLVLVLVACKYMGLLTETVASLRHLAGGPPVWSFEAFFLPLGISYITFKHISYLTDVHWKLVGRERLEELLCYSALFTIFVAGPIERFERFQPQFAALGRWPGGADLEFAFRRVVFGLVKKCVLADWIGLWTAPVWAQPAEHALGMRALSLLGYSLQIYLDFAGYSDIAIGTSRLYGLTIMENFSWPYLQPNISQFWRHWHISLSDWIRDYVFFPLSRVSRAPLWSRFVVPLIAMGLCGLWHGAAWHFLAWGLWHGAGIAALQAWNATKRRHKIAPWRGTRGRIATAAGTLFTFVFVTVGWLLFRG